MGLLYFNETDAFSGMDTRITTLENAGGGLNKDLIMSGTFDGYKQYQDSSLSQGSSMPLQNINVNQDNYNKANDHVYLYLMIELTDINITIESTNVYGGKPVLFVAPPGLDITVASSALNSAMICKYGKANNIVEYTINKTQYMIHSYFPDTSADNIKYYITNLRSPGVNSYAIGSGSFQKNNCNFVIFGGYYLWAGRISGSCGIYGISI